VLWGLAALVAGCASHTPTPLDLPALLDGLRATSAESARPALGDDFEPVDGLDVLESLALAVTLNPELRARRAALGVAEAQLVQAGTLPDPNVEWNLSESELELFLPLRRPDEGDALEGLAVARLLAVDREVLQAEWALGRDVHLAFLEVLGAARRRELNAQLERVAARTHAFFLRAREHGAATALQETTAALQLAEVRLAGRGLEGAEQAARRAFHALLGLPPDARVTLQLREDPFADAEFGEADAAWLTQRALEARPDLQRLVAAHDAADQALRLAIARQWPAWGVGTSLFATLPLLSRFNAPAIATARARRERLALDVVAAIHSVRAEVHDALGALRTAERRVEFLRDEVAPRLEESLALTEAAFDARQLTAGEIFTAQRQVLQARQVYLDARIERARARVVLNWSTGRPDGEIEP